MKHTFFEYIHNDETFCLLSHSIVVYRYFISVPEIESSRLFPIRFDRGEFHKRYYVIGHMLFYSIHTYTSTVSNPYFDPMSFTKFTCVHHIESSTILQIHYVMDCFNRRFWSFAILEDTRRHTNLWYNSSKLLIKQHAVNLNLQLKLVKPVPIKDF